MKAEQGPPISSNAFKRFQRLVRGLVAVSKEEVKAAEAR
jgi:hypothetical protein